MCESEQMKAAEGDLEPLRRQKFQFKQELQLKSQRQSRRISQIDSLRPIETKTA